MIKMQCLARFTISKLTAPVLFSQLERKKEHELFYMLPTHIPINMFLYKIYKSDNLRKRSKLWIKGQGLELSRKQPRFLLIWFQEMIIMLFYLRLGSSFGKKIFPQEILAQLKQLIFPDYIQDPYFSIFATQWMVAQSHAFGWLFKTESTTLMELISLLAFHKMPLLHQKMDKNQNRHPSFPATAVWTIKTSVWLSTVS